jgi:hypothetical protein
VLQLSNITRSKYHSSQNVQFRMFSGRYMWRGMPRDRFMGEHNAKDPTSLQCSTNWVKLFSFLSLCMFFLSCPEFLM